MIVTGNLGQSQCQSQLAILQEKTTKTIGLFTRSLPLELQSVIKAYKYTDVAYRNRKKTIIHAHQRLKNYTYYAYIYLPAQNGLAALKLMANS